jgi:hypothetical protein
VHKAIAKLPFASLEQAQLSVGVKATPRNGSIANIENAGNLVTIKLLEA